MGNGLWKQLPEEFRERLERASRRPARPVARAEEDPLPPCDTVSSPYGPSLVRTFELGPGESGLQGVFHKLSNLADVLVRGVDVPPDLGSLSQAGLSRTVFLDLETTGFSSTPVFLAGTLRLGEDRLAVRQFFARDYSQEKSLLHHLSLFLEPFDVLVTFNGKSYDIPFLRDRLCFHGLPFRPVDVHLDLLHPARRRWKYELPNCRLVTLERYLCHRLRHGDLPGAEIPAVYHEFVRTGVSSSMRRVFHHNVLDLITLAELLAELATPSES